MPSSVKMGFKKWGHEFVVLCPRSMSRSPDGNSMVTFRLKLWSGQKGTVWGSEAERWLIRGQRFCYRDKTSSLLSFCPTEIREAFKVFDRDGNGFISKQELGMAMRSLGYMPNEVELEVIIQRLDIDGRFLFLPQPVEKCQQLSSMLTFLHLSSRWRSGWVWRICHIAGSETLFCGNARQVPRSGFRLGVLEGICLSLHLDCFY